MDDVRCHYGHSSASQGVVTTARSGWNWPSGRAAVIVVEEPAESLLAMDRALDVPEDGINQLVAYA